MPTDKPRYSITVDDELLEKIDDYRFKNRYASRSAATVDIIKIGLQRIEAEQGRKHFRTIKYYNVSASAGYGEWIDDNSYEDFDIPDIPEYSHADFAVRVNGDSMEPDFEDGDIVLVHSQDTTLDGIVGVWWVEGEGSFIKELRNGSLYPHNKKYTPITLRGKDYRCFGKVIAKLEK